MNKFFIFSILPLLMGAVAANAQANLDPIVVTASNDANSNQLLVYNTAGTLLQTIPTQGKGGVGGNAGGVMAHGNLVAVVNFGSKTVTIFRREPSGLHVTQVIQVALPPVSVAFGHHHLYVLETTKVESLEMFGPSVGSSPDGVAPLLMADGSAGQVGVLPDQLIITEKSSAVETVNLTGDGAVSGTATSVQNIPANVNTPLGLVTRGKNAYVTIAHADEIALVRNDDVLTVTPSVTQHAPCWLTLVGPFLFSSNSPSMSVSRYLVYGKQIVQEVPVAAQFDGAPTDIDSGEGMVAVIDGSGAISHLSIFNVDDDGNLTLKASTTISAKINGVAIVP